MNAAEASARASRFSRERWDSSIALVAAGYLFSFGFIAWNILRGNHVWHDSLQIATHLNLLLDSLVRGELPLWSPELSGGSPLWPSLEAFLPLHDPVLFLVGLPLAAFGANAEVVYLAVSLAWIFAFIAGYWSLARLLRIPRGIAGAGSLCLFVNLVPMMFMQVVPFMHSRYLPWIVFFAGKSVWPDRDSDRWRGPATNVGLAVGLTGISACGANSSYLLAGLCLLLLVGAIVLLGTRRLRRDPPRLSLGGKFGAAWILGVGAAFGGTLAYLLWYLNERVVLKNREIAKMGWWPDLPTHFDLGRVFPGHLPSQGALFCGIPFAICVFLGLSLMACPRVSRTRARLAYWGLATALSIYMVFEGFPRLVGQGNTLLSMRNWGFFLAQCNLFLALAAGLGAKLVLRYPGRAFMSWRFLAWFGLIAVYLTRVGDTASFALDSNPKHFYDPAGVRESGHLATSLLLLATLAGLAAIALALIKKTWKKGVEVALVGLAVLAACTYLVGQKSSLGSRFSRQAIEGPDTNRPFLLTPGAIARSEPIHRGWRSSPATFYPMTQDGPTGFHLWIADYPPAASSMGSFSGEFLPVSHNFETTRLELLKQGKVAPETFRMVTGVDSPITRVVNQIVSRETPGEVLGSLEYLPTEYWESTAYIESPKPLDEMGPLCPPFQCTSLYREKSGSQFEIAYQTPSAAWVLFAMNPDSDWTARIDGRRIPIYPANLNSMAFRVPKGKGLIELSYRPLVYLALLSFRMVLAIILVRAIWSRCRDRLFDRAPGAT